MHTAIHRYIAKAKSIDKRGRRDWKHKIFARFSRVMDDVMLIITSTPRDLHEAGTQRWMIQKL